MLKTYLVGRVKSGTFLLFHTAVSANQGRDVLMTNVKGEMSEHLIEDGSVLPEGNGVVVEIVSETRFLGVPIHHKNLGSERI